ncbi:MAG: DUF1553 domain-containing protein [Planctomycetaceae bacterium]
MQQFIIITSVLFAFAIEATSTIAQQTNAPTDGASFASDDDRQHFESKVRPLLIQHCAECHGKEKHKGELRILSQAHLLEGGESGPAIVPGDPDASLLIQAMKYQGLEMPPAGKLPDEQIQVIADWIRKGAIWPADDEAGAPVRSKDATISEEDRSHWSFHPVRKPEVPKLPHGGTPFDSPIDAFLYQRLREQGLVANEAAAVRTLIKRAFFGLTGLPPGYEELESWANRIQPNGDSFDANEYSLLLDDLMSRPAYGEHWARHWLDVVRFAQSNGYERDGYKPYAWRYRDYVVQAFLNDKPYDRFVMEQLAGDELPDSDSSSRVATGYYRLGTFDDEPDDKRQAEFDELDDVMVTVGASFLGLTIGCARCHEHKFDPIPQADYYRLLAHFRNIRRYDNPAADFDNAGTLPLGDSETIRKAVEAFREQQRQREQKLAAALSDEERRRLDSELPRPALSNLEWTIGVRENSGLPPETNVLIRGTAATPGSTVQAGFLSVLERSSPSISYTSESPLNDILPSSGRRLALARWLTSPDHPLTARVLVNRVWHYHFGRGIVSTTGDFGKAGDRPSHPELLDWLAADFVEHGWSIKHLHKRILMSDAFRRSSGIDESPQHQAAKAKDPDNRLLWRGSLRRLDAESIRDRMLVTSGELNPTVGGREMYPRLSGEVLAGQSKPGLGWETSTVEDQKRRSLYAVVKRSVRDPLLEALDYSNTTSPLTERPLTTVAPQALLMLHGHFTAERAEALAEKIQAEHHDIDSQIRASYRRILQREPSSAELTTAKRVLGNFEETLRPESAVITFRPDVPVSLYSEYRRQLQGPDFLIGPEGWQFRSGIWGGGYEGIDVVDVRQGPHAFWSGGPFRLGTLKGSLRFDATTERITLLARADAEGDGWNGLGLTIDPLHRSIELRQRFRGKDAVEYISLPDDAALPANEWIPFEWELSEQSTRFVLGHQRQQIFATTLPEDASVEGRLGVAVWGGAVSFNQFQWISNDSGAKTFALHEASFDSSPAPPGWSLFEGQWRRVDDSTWMVSQHNGGKILLDKTPLHDGEVQIEMKMTPGRANIGGLLLRVSEPRAGADNWFGYEVSLDLPGQVLLFGEHRQDWRPKARVPISVKPGEWHTLRAVIQGNRLQVYVDDAPSPTLDTELEQPLEGNLFGLRTWGSEITYRNVRTRPDSAGEWQTETWPRITPKPAGGQQDDVSHRALAALARTLMNLNEFVYVP